MVDIGIVDGKHSLGEYDALFTISMPYSELDKPISNLLSDITAWEKLPNKNNETGNAFRQTLINILRPQLLKPRGRSLNYTYVSIIFSLLCPDFLGTFPGQL